MAIFAEVTENECTIERLLRDEQFIVRIHRLTTDCVT